MNPNVDHLQQQLATRGNEAPPPEAWQQFHEVTREAPREALQQGLQHAFESDRTPPFPQMVGQLFGGADMRQREGMLGTLLAALGPAGQSVLREAGIDKNPQRATELSTGQVEELARKAQDTNPGVVGQMSQFYAQHPTLVKSLGGMALALMLGRMHSRH